MPANTECEGHAAREAWLASLRADAGHHSSPDAEVVDGGSNPLRRRIAAAIRDTPARYPDDIAAAVDAVVQPELGRLAALREQAEAHVRTLEAELAALRVVSRGYCPTCGRGDAAPTVEHWERERDRAQQAEAAVTRGPHSPPDGLSSAPTAAPPPNCAPPSTSLWRADRPARRRGGRGKPKPAHAPGAALGVPPCTATQKGPALADPFFW